MDEHIPSRASPGTKVLTSDRRPRNRQFHLPLPSPSLRLVLPSCRAPSFPNGLVIVVTTMTYLASQRLVLPLACAPTQSQTKRNTTPASPLRDILQDACQGCSQQTLNFCLRCHLLMPILSRIPGSIPPLPEIGHTSFLVWTIHRRDCLLQSAG